MEIKTYTGQITEDWTGDGFGEISVGNIRLASEWAHNLELGGAKIHLRYFVSGNPITQNPDELLLRAYFGEIEVEHEGIYGSEWTGQYDIKEFFTIDGHNLYRELADSVGKYCYIELWGMG